MKVKFYRCAHCGNIIHKIYDAGVPVVCCGQKMEEMVPNTVEASTEKHLPKVELEGKMLSVDVGSVSHPMEDKHFIEWVCVETEKGILRKHLNPGEEPKLHFDLGEEKAVAVYAYCNLHGLWKTEL